eukprot:jgi/Chrzof1/7481/Cz02g25160.t1
MTRRPAGHMPAQPRHAVAGVGSADQEDHEDGDDEYPGSLLFELKIAALVERLRGWCSASPDSTDLLPALALGWDAIEAAWATGSFRLLTGEEEAAQAAKALGCYEQQECGHQRAPGSAGYKRLPARNGRPW